MLTDRGRGFESSQKMNDEFWEELGTHKQRMMEQMQNLERFEGNPELEAEMKNADSVYEAARTYLAKYK